MNHMTSGASNDIERATDIAQHMVCEWGMSELGPLAFRKPGNAYESDRAHVVSEATAQRVDEEIRKVVMDGYAHAQLAHREEPPRRRHDGEGAARGRVARSRRAEGAARPRRRVAELRKTKGQGPKARAPDSLPVHGSEAPESSDFGPFCAYNPRTDGPALPRARLAGHPGRQIPHRAPARSRRDGSGVRRARRHARPAGGDQSHPPRARSGSGGARTLHSRSADTGAAEASVHRHGIRLRLIGGRRAVPGDGAGARGGSAAGARCRRQARTCSRQPHPRCGLRGDGVGASRRRPPRRPEA